MDALNTGQASQPGRPGAIDSSGGPSLRPYQVDSLAAVWRAFQGGQNRLLVKKPTGTGKTVTFAAMLRYGPMRAWLEGFPKRERGMLVIAHREELLFQAAEKIQKANPDKLVSIEQGELHANSQSDIVIASIQTLAARKFTRLKRLLQRHTFRLVIVDEAHHAAAATYRTALVHLGFLPPADASDSEEMEAVDYDDVAVMQAALETWDRGGPSTAERLLVGMTATPNRTDAIGLGCVFQTIAYSYGLKQAIDDGWLVPPVPWVVETATDLDDVRISHGDFNQKDLANAVNNQRRNQLAIAGWNEHAYGLSTIAFTVDVQHAHDLAAEFEAAGIRSRAISAETPKDERRLTLRQYTEGQIQVITNCMVLTEGTDLPRTGCILHAKPTKSATLYEQMTGRGLRLFDGKKECIVLDVVDVARRHSLQTAPVLMGLPPGLDGEGKSLAELARMLDELKEKYPGLDIDAAFKEGTLTLAELQARASTFDIWQIPSLGAFGVGRALNWMKFGEDMYRLTYPWGDGVETLVVLKDLIGKWLIELTLRPRETPWASRQRTLAQDIPTADAAAGVAEAFVLQERRSVVGMKDPKAAWRSGEPSPGQLGMMKRLRIPVPKDCTKGQASDLIDLAQGRRGR